MFIQDYLAELIGVGDGAGRGEVQGGHVPLPPKFGRKYFSGNYYVKFGHFGAKIM